MTPSTLTRAPAPDHDDLVDRLNTHSTRYRDPVQSIPWDTLDPNLPWLPDHLISLHGTETFDRMTPAQRRRLSHCEFVAFCELGLWLEMLFIQRLGGNSLTQLYRDPDDYHYQLHELREEVGHSLMFLETRRRSGIDFMTPPHERPPLARLFARFAPQHAAAFWATILIGEDVPDRMGRLIVADRTLPEAVLAITRLHSREEARHIAFARTMIARKTTTMPSWQKAATALMLREIMRQFLDTAFYPSPRVYRAAGLDQPRARAAEARSNPHRIALRAQCAAPSRATLRDSGFNL
ncbi:diiron oxygenase [Acidiphilium acidophilum]|jgi:P-aminobenzoate N-oxygenase AurF.|uniref:Diiron oxygenase n=1 Tax=Acidiphilium acidophilum TaxID=76588 RepID=A0AAW9DRU0_ACIAO|nr:diiron oxygenase [Acidiphilium acidophilum]MDX5931934.1 diiron oxygenase [Acidiphilium acidophilum]